MLYWNQFADEGEVTDAEAKIWSASGPRAYIFGVAKHVAAERKRRAQREVQLDPVDWSRRESNARDTHQVEARQYLEAARATLAPHKWRILIEYLRRSNHEALCKELNVTPGYLRVMVHRIRNELRANITPRAGPRPADRGHRRTGHR